MEMLERLTRRQLDVLRAVQATATSERGAPLNSIASALSVSAPSALQHLTAVEELGLVSRHRGKSRLSARGELTLAEYRRHHRIAEGLFGRLGLPASQVCAAAREVDLALSHLTIERLCDAEGHPEVCPHGEPIPPCSGQRGGA
jgi:DtxR family transcriptional regulator, Mn-dependent transcriptional regulator